MQDKALVSIITPCHNSSSFIHRLMDSILSQTYPNIEMFAIDNDSTDDTQEVIKNYISKFKEKGYSLTYIHQPDLGPSSAIQTGLRLISGKYLLMPDSDDYYNMPSSIEKWVDTFERLPEDYAIVRSQLQVVEEVGLKKTRIIYKDLPIQRHDTLFDDCLYGTNEYCFAPINYMVKIAALRELTDMEIYNAYNMGQQRQICLPLYYNYKGWTIPEPLACYLVRQKSISHGDYTKYRTQRELYFKQEEYIDSILNDKIGIPTETRKQYRNKYLQKQTIAIVDKAISSGNNEDIKLYKNRYKSFGGNTGILSYHIIRSRIKTTLTNTIKKFKI